LRSTGFAAEAAAARTGIGEVSRFLAFDSAAGTLGIGAGAPGAGVTGANTDESPGVDDCWLDDCWLSATGLCAFGLVPAELRVGWSVGSLFATSKACAAFDSLVGIDATGSRESLKEASRLFASGTGTTGSSPLASWDVAIGDATVPAGWAVAGGAEMTASRRSSSSSRQTISLSPGMVWVEDIV
jgi:hypothetical protein